MKIKEKLTAWKGKLKSTRVVQRVLNSRITMWFGHVFAHCRENPFPAQILLTIAYRLVLDLLYIASISPLYAYSGLTLDIEPLRYLASLLSMVIFAPFVAKLINDGTPSAILVTVLNFLYFIPFTSYCGCKGSDMSFFLIGLAYWALLLLLQCRIPVLALRPLNTKSVHPFAKLLTIGAILLVLGISGKYTGFRLTLDFINVYDVRLEARSYSMPTLLSYALSAMTVVLAVLLMYWLKKKKYIVVAVLGVTYLFYFSIGAHKSVFLLLALVIAAFFFYRDWMLRWLPGALTVAAGIALLEEKLVGSFYIMTLFFRRMMYLPVKISEQRFVFFQENPLNLFRDGIMGKLSFESIYSSTIARVIGEYRGNPEESANNGLLGDLFTNLPIGLGLILMPLILILCFRLLDLAAAKLERKYLLPFCILFANSFINGSWSTVLLSGGFLLACVLLYFFPKEEHSRL